MAGCRLLEQVSLFEKFVTTRGFASEHLTHCASNHFTHGMRYHHRPWITRHLFILISLLLRRLAFFFGSEGIKTFVFCYNDSSAAYHNGTI